MRRLAFLSTFTLLALTASIALGQHFEFDINQGNHSLLILESRINDEFVDAGDEVGVFTPGGVCSGAWVYEEAGDVSVGIAAWGDDQDQGGINGFRNGEAFAFRFWDHQTNLEIAAEPEYISGPQAYERDAFTLLNLSGVLEGPPIVVIREGDNVLGEGGDEMGHDFGNVLVDNSTEWVFILGNGGVDPLVIESLTADPGVYTTDFPEEGMTIEAGQGTEVTVTFTPVAEEAYNGSLTIVSNAEHGDAVIQLSGSGVVERLPDIAVNPIEFDFGPVEVGHSAFTNLTVSNVGNAALTVTRIAVDGDAFSVNFDGEQVIEEGDSAGWSVTFEPPAEDSYHAWITIFSDDPDEGEVVVEMIGDGMIVPAPDIATDPDSLIFGRVVVGSEETMVLTISNVGDVDLSITAITSDNEVFTTDYEEEIPDGPHWPVTPTDGNMSVLILEATINGEALQIDDEVGAFTPDGFCAGSSVVETVDEAIGLAVWGDDRDQVGIQGFITGQQMSFRLWDLSARREYAANAEVIQGNLEYDRDAFTIVNLSAGNQRNPAENLESVLEPGASMEVTVFFTPTDFDNYEGILTISSDDPDSPELEIRLSGQGVESPPRIIVSDESLDFGTVVVGSSAALTFDIANEGASTLIGSLEIEIGDSVDTEIFSFNPDEFSLDPGENVEITVEFAPEEAGGWEMPLHILSNDPEFSDVVVALIGEARDPEPNIFISDGGGFMFADNVDYDFGPVFIGDSEIWNLQIANRGEVSLTVQEIRSDEGAFTANLAEPGTIEPGQSVGFDIEFSPAEEREYEGTLTVISDDPDAGEFFLQVVGLGVMERLPDISVMNVLDFEALFPGMERTLNIEGVNAGLANLTIIRVAIDGAGFSVAFEGDLVVAPNEGFSIPVTFAPDQVGEYHGSAVIVSDDPDEGEVTVELTGRAIPEGNHFEFNINADNMSIIVEDATIDGERLISGDEAAVFTTRGFCAGATVVGDEWPIGVAAWGEDRNREGEDGFNSGEAIIWHIWDQSAGMEFEAAAEYIVGEGFYETDGFSVVRLAATQEETPRIRLEEPLLNFGTILIDDMGSETLHIANIGDADLVIESISTDGAPFEVGFGEAVVIGPEGVIEIEVVFVPEEAGEYFGVLTVISNDPDNPEVSIELTGICVEPSPPQIQLSAVEHTFGEIGVGEREMWELVVSNIGGDVLHVDSPVLDGSGFEVVPDAPFELGVGDAISLEITFAPPEEGDYQSILRLNSDDPANEQVTVELTGSAVASPMHWRVQPTDGNMSLLIENATLDGEQLPIGAEVAAFTTGGLAAGSSRIEEYPFGIAAWGDDNNTEDVVEGFVEGEAISYRVWLPELGAEFAAVPEYSLGEGVYSRDAFSVLSLTSTTPEGQDHFIYQITNVNHSLLVISASLNDEFLAVGDEVGVFTTRGLCAGSTILEEAGDVSFGIAAWGDDRDTQPVEGFANDEIISFRYWDASAGREYAGVEAMIEEGSINYSSNGFTVLSLDLYTLPQAEIEIDFGHDFGRVDVGSSVVWELNVGNSGNADLVISAIGGVEPPFGVAFDEAVTIPSGEARAFEVSFSPEQAGDFADILIVQSNDRDESVVEIALTGSAFNPNHTPFWVEPPEMVEGAEGELLEFTITASDPDNDQLSLMMIDNELPPFVDFTDNGNGTGTFSWTPGYTDAGEYHPLFVVSDGNMEAETAVTIMIENVDAPPVYTSYPESIEVDEGAQTQFTITAEDVDGDAFAFEMAIIDGNPGVMPEFVDNGDGSATFTWTPGFEDAGEYLFEFHLLSQNMEFPDVVIEIPATVYNVNRPPEVVNPIADVEIDEDSGPHFVANLYDVFADPDGDELSFTTEGFMFTAVNEEGDLSITPADNYFGSGEIAVWAMDRQDEALVAFRINDLGGASAAGHQPVRRMRSVEMAAPKAPEANRDLEVSDVFSVTVRPVNDEPDWVEVPRPGEPIEVDETDLIEFNVSASDIDNEDLELTFDPGNFPEDAVLIDNGDGTGTFRWQTDFGSSGNYRGGLIVSDGELTDDEVIFITVHNVNRPPVWDNIRQQVQGRENEAIQFVVEGSDPDENEVTISLMDNNLPDEAALQDHHDGTATFRWTPTFDESGEYSAIFRIADAQSFTDEEVTFNIAHVDRPIVFNELPDREIREGQGEVQLFDLSEFFADPDGDNIGYSVESNEVLHAAIEGTTLTVNAEENVSGEFDIVVDADNQGSHQSDTFVLTILPMNDEPFWVDPVEEVSVQEGERIEFSLQADDVDLDWEGDELTVFLRVEDGVVRRGASFNRDGARGTFIWDTDFEDAGVYNPIFRVEDHGGSFADLEITITIGDVNLDPVITQPVEDANYNVEIAEQAELRIDLSAEDADGDDIEWSIARDGLPNGYQFTDHGDGTATFLWTPPSDARREPYTPVFTASDGRGGSDELNVAITVTNVNRLPVITDPANADIFRVEAEEGQRLIVDFRSTDADGGNPAWVIIDEDGLPDDGWTFTDNEDGTAQFVFDVPFEGEDRVYDPLFRTTDADNGIDQIQVIITIRDINRAPVIEEPTEEEVYQIDVDENEELTVLFDADDPDGGAIAWEMVDNGGLPDGWQFTDNGNGSASFVWTPGFDDAREDPYIPVFVASDNEPLTDIIRIEITVNNVNRPPEVRLDIEDVEVDEDAGRYDIGDLSPYFFDPDGDNLQFNIAGAPDELGMALENGRTLYFEPDPNYHLAGGAVITVTATDGAEQISQQFTVTVNPVNDNPSGCNLLAPIDGTVLVNYRGTFRWSSAHDVDRDPIRYSVVFTFLDQPIDTTFRYSGLVDTSFTLTGLDTLMARAGVLDTLRIRWWIEATDGTVMTESNQRWTVVIPPLNAPGSENFLPVEVSLSQNYPNPFNPETKLSFALPRSGDVKLTVFDMHARTVATLADGRFEAGRHEVTWDASGRTAGIYLFVLQVDGQRHIVKGAMLK